MLDRLWAIVLAGGEGTRLRDLARGLVSALLKEVVDGDAGSLFRQRQADAAADTTPAAGHQRDTVFDAEIHESPPVSEPVITRL